jgi:hypothetical protein
MIPPTLGLRLLRAGASMAAVLSAQQAAALEIKSCEDAHVGLTELIAPVASNSKTYKDGKISLYAVDTVEPVCCAAGVALVIPDVSDETGGNQCLAVVGVASVQLDETTTEDDAQKGMLLTIPARVFNEAADSAPGAPLKLRVNVDKGTVALE